LKRKRPAKFLAAQSSALARKTEIFAGLAARVNRDLIFPVLWRVRLSIFSILLFLLSKLLDACIGEVLLYLVFKQK
jgi:hypothetical protein